MNGPRARVLILGGGDGLAAREVLRYDDVRSVTVVELDPEVTRLARTDPALSELNGHAFRDPRLTVVSADAFPWLRADRGRYDVVVSDLPDPGITASTKLYSAEFYGLVAEALAPDGRLVVHAGPLGARPQTFWTVEASVRAGGLAPRPYRVTGRYGGFAASPDRGGDDDREREDWGFLLAGPGAAPQVVLGAGGPKPRSLESPELREGAREAASPGCRASLPRR